MCYMYRKEQCFRQRDQIAKFITNRQLKISRMELSGVRHDKIEHILVRWTPPARGFFKLNCDHSWRSKSDGRLQVYFKEL